MSESFENVFEIDVAEMLELLQITIIRMILGQFLGCRIRDLWKFWMAFEIDPKLVRNLILILRPPTLSYLSNKRAEASTENIVMPCLNQRNMQGFKDFSLLP